MRSNFYGRDMTTSTIVDRALATRVDDGPIDIDQINALLDGARSPTR